MLLVKHTEGPHLTRILGLEKTLLRKICISGTIGGPLLMQKIPHLHIHQPKTVAIPFKSSKRWVGGVRKWQFSMIYSTVNHQRGGWLGLKIQKRDDLILEWSLSDFCVSGGHPIFSTSTILVNSLAHV